MTRLTALPDDERCRVVLIGDGSIAMHCLRSLRTAGHEVVACFANGEAFATSARRDGIMTYDPGTPFTLLTDMPCDWIVSADNARLIPPEILHHPAQGSINFHDGPLPRYAGLHAPTRALLDGKTAHAVTWHMVEEGIDTGGVIMQTPVPIHDDDTSQSLSLRCLEAGAQGFDILVRKLGHPPLALRQQDLNERTYFGSSHWPREGMEINWQWPASRIQRIVRALDFGPFPNHVGSARFRFDGKVHRLLDAEVCSDHRCVVQNAQPGMMSIAPDGRLHIATSDGCLIVTHLTPIITAETCCRVGRVEIKQPDELARIAAWEEGIFRFEGGWRRRVQNCSRATDDPKYAADTPRERSAVDLGTTGHDLACGLLAWALTFRKTHIEMGRWWSEEELNECVASAGDPAVVSLLNPVVPVLIKIEEGDSILAFADKWLESVANTQRRGPFFADLLDRGGKGESPMVDPAALPIQWLQESVGADSTNASSWQIHRENGRWLASGISDMSHVGELAATLRKMIRDQPATSIAALPRLGPEAELLLRRWESGGSFETTPESFLALIFGKFVSDEGSTAIETADGQFWTYGRLGREVASLMARLRAMGVEQGHMVPIRLGRSPELVTAQLAVMGLGCAFVPISDEDPDLRVLDVLARTHARVAIGLPPQDSDTTTWIAPLSDHKDPGVGVLSNLDVSLEGSIACVFFTSGSTGRPKGVKITHVGLDAYVDDSVKYFGRVALQRSIWTSSVAFDSTLSEVMISLSIGGSIVIPRPESVWSVRGFVESLSLYKITFVGISTDLWSMWMRDAPHVVNPVPSTLRLVGVGGGVLATELVERWLSIADDSILLCNGYGPTETTVVCTHYDIGRESLSFPSTPIGFPNRGAMIRVLDDHGRRVPPGIEGEIVIGGLGVADGYLDDPEETEARFVQLTDEEGRWYRSGDIGSWTEAGELLFHGRADEQVKIHGYRVEPEGICRAIRSLPGVNDAEVIAFKTQASKELGAVVIRMAEGASSVDGDSGSDLRMLDQDWTVWLQNQLEDKLPRHAVPRRWLLVDEWPRTTTGKVDQVELVSRFDSLARSADSVELIDPRDGRSVLQAIRNVLARPNADPSESFFDLGGDSMAAMGLQLELESAVGRSLPLTLVYGSKTIAEIIEGVADQADGRIDVKIDGWQSVIMTPGGVDLVFMPGYWGRAQLRHVWTEVGAFASIHAIDLGVEDYRQIASEVPDEEAFKCLADKLAQLVIEHLPDRRPLMVGYSSGGWFAFETANAMRRRGVQTPRLLLIEPDIYVGGRWEFRLWHRLDRLLNRIVHGRLFGRSRKTTGNAQQDNSSDDQRGDVPEVVREIHEKLDRFLASYRPERGDAPIHLVVRDGLAWRYATWRRLARGPFQREEVQFADHLDFKRPGSETVLTELLRRVAASHAANGDNSSS